MKYFSIFVAFSKDISIVWQVDIRVTDKWEIQQE